ncbi:hypothetical protein SD70_06130 [Gordoniibacillus kamchatkensis]|uniref:Cupin domain-containing protein n=1 Tax=Gordoniibacillus kamchatkensis TaxID=1590651 RepID=A0ABR5AKW7_9BACL|nr:hypothetical protein [Paenibacillus sp. VKM B-2647]KIL41684.1 hypothetical protein SD70_06130 [Paenibacillus sp. VKM B-2647]
MNRYPLSFEESFIRPVLDNGVSKVVKFSFPKGKVLRKHKTTSDILVFVLQGKVRFSADEEVELEAINLLCLDKQVEHSIEALEDSLVVVVMTPSPEAHSLLKP